MSKYHQNSTFASWQGRPHQRYAFVARGMGGPMIVADARLFYHTEHVFTEGEIRRPLGMVVIVADPNHREWISVYAVSPSDDVFPTESVKEDPLGWMDDVFYVEI